MTFEYIDTIPPGATVLYVDASLLKKSYCDTAFVNTLAGLRQKRKDPILTFGTAVHAYAAARHENMLAALGKAIDIYQPVDPDIKQLQNVCAAMPANLLPPPIVVGERSGREFWFEAPWLSFVFGGVVYAIVICGTMDHVSFERGYLRIFDYKTSRGYRLNDIRSGYKNDVQFSFYPWAIWKFGAHFLPLEMYNAARDLKITTQVVVAQIALKPPAWSVDSPVTCSTARFEEFELEVKRLLERLIPIYLRAGANDVPWQNGHLSNQCPRCPFNELCFALPGMEDAVRSSLYMQKQYTPKTHS